MKNTSHTKESNRTGIFTFKKNYLCYTVFLLIVEILIALYVKDALIRPYGGDFLVVILIYCFLRTFLQLEPLVLAIGTLLFSFAVEFAQYFKVVEILGLKGNRLAEVIIGTGFSAYDLLAYTLGVLFVYGLEKISLKKNA